MKNITVSVPEAVYREARIRAAERGSSVSALVSEFLGSLSTQDAEMSRFRSQWDQLRDEIKNFSGSDRLDRNDLHGRALR